MTLLYLYEIQTKLENLFGTCVSMAMICRTLRSKGCSCLVMWLSNVPSHLEHTYGQFIHLQSKEPQNRAEIKDSAVQLGRLFQRTSTESK